MKFNISHWGFVIAIAATGCQQNSPTPPDADQSVGAISEATESVNSDEPIDSNADIRGDEHAAAVDEEHSEHEMQEHGPGMGPGLGGMGRGMGMGRGPAALDGMRADMTTLHTMFAARDKIIRAIKMLPNGAEATTESDDATIAALLQEHVPAMEGRVMENNPLPPMTFHPVFVELIKHADDYSLEYEETDKGIKVTYQSEDPFVVMLVQEHAKLVSRFIKNGMEEIHTPYTLPETPAAVQKDAKGIALAAKEALFARLSGRLTEVMKADGPVAAIQVCSREAGIIAIDVGDKFDVRIGRTAAKLRNPQNKPPEWVEPLIEESPSEPLFVDLPNGHTGALLPIKLQAKCIICHGPADTIADDVKTQLAELYPQDHATGFKEGDLRGWFWVDVPKLAQ